MRGVDTFEILMVQQCQQQSLPTTGRKSPELGSAPRSTRLRLPNRRIFPSVSSTPTPPSPPDPHLHNSTTKFSRVNTDFVLN
jgi:hypothetical protein